MKTELCGELTEKEWADSLEMMQRTKEAEARAVEQIAAHKATIRRLRQELQRLARLRRRMEWAIEICSIGRNAVSERRQLEEIMSL